jgi:2-methylisocitrate lyase-like PEP mutase family enzyme
MRPPLQKEKAIQFRQFHEGPPTLVLPNAWDAASAYLFERVGFRAIATTSSGVAAALGYADGQISWAMTLEVIERIARVRACTTWSSPCQFWQSDDARGTGSAAAFLPGTA